MTKPFNSKDPIRAKINRNMVELARAGYQANFDKPCTLTDEQVFALIDMIKGTGESSAAEDQDIILAMAEQE